MDIMYRCESEGKYPIYMCISGCRRIVASFTRFGLSVSVWGEYCDECAKGASWTGVDMYLEFAESSNVYIVYNSASIGPIFPAGSVTHDFRLNKI